MNAIKIAKQKVTILDSMLDYLIQCQRNAKDNIEHVKQRIAKEMATDYPELKEGSEEYSERYAENWNYSNLLDNIAYDKACTELMKDLEKLAGVK